MGKNSDYINQLKQLVLRVQTRVGRLDNKTNEILLKASNWICPDKEEKKLFDDLIIRAKEFIELEKIEEEHKYSKDDQEKYSSYYKWFTSINMLLETFDVQLSQISFTDLALWESD